MVEAGVEAEEGVRKLAKQRGKVVVFRCSLYGKIGLVLQRAKRVVVLEKICKVMPIPKCSGPTVSFRRWTNPPIELKP